MDHRVIVRTEMKLFRRKQWREKASRFGVKKFHSMISTLWFIKGNKTRLHKNSKHFFPSNDTMKEELKASSKLGESV